MKIATYGLILFASLSIANKTDHIMGGYFSSSYQWIYVVVLFLLGAFFYKKFKKIFFIFLLVGIGIILLDYREALSLKYWGLEDFKI